jgi:exportin-2 (importin alpha re-exporter)
MPLQQLANKKKTEDGNHTIKEEEVNAVKNNIVTFMVELPANLQAQIGEAISVIADSDFPHRWENLIIDLTSKLTDNNISQNNGVLTVAHSIFSRWRPLFRSDELFLEIKLVLSVFCEPFFNLLKLTDRLIQENANNKSVLLELFKSLNLLVAIYYDLNCQDLPEYFEDHLNEGFEIIHKYYVYNNPLLHTDDEEESGPLEQLKSNICELLQLYTQRYEDVFTVPLSQFIESTLQILVHSNSEKKYDIVVSKALSFLTSTARVPSHAENFSTDATLPELIKNIILPNTALTPADEELFEDDPIEFIRRDLEGSDSDTRRRGCMDFLRELSYKNEAKLTNVVMKFVTEFLAAYNSNKENWRQKDTAIFLFSSISAKGNVTTAGVATTNLLVDVNAFFKENLASDLVSEDVHPILKIDAIKFIHTFRNQLSRDILIQAFPLLASHMQSPIYVVYTYAAITIEKIISLRDPSTQVQMFNKSDIESVAQSLLLNLFNIILRAGSPEKLAENEFLMRCIMRILITAQDTVAPYALEVLNQLVAIVGAISKNPSNPRFTHYTFESIAGIIKYGHKSIGIRKFEDSLFPGLMNILANEISEFIPYAFQILGQLLSFTPKNEGLSDNYVRLIEPLTAASLWELKGNVPALASLLGQIVEHGSNVIVSSGRLIPCLGIFQKLISSRAFEIYSLDLLDHILFSIPLESLQPYLSEIANVLTRRLNGQNTARFLARLSFSFCLWSSTAELGPYFLVKMLDFNNKALWKRFDEAIEGISTFKTNREKRIAVIGLSNLLFQVQEFYSGEPLLFSWTKSIQQIIDLFLNGLGAKEIEDNEPQFVIDDYTFGSSYSKLALVKLPPIEPTTDVRNAQEYFINGLKDLNARSNGTIASEPRYLGSLPDIYKGHLARLGFA